jgi:ankyrin repeat protein
MRSVRFGLTQSRCFSLREGVVVYVIIPMDLYFAVKEDDIQKATELIDNGADVNQKQIPFYFIFSRKLLILFHLFSFFSFFFFPFLSNNDETPLHWAAMYGSVNCAKLLIEKGANLNALTAYFVPYFT